MSGWPYAGWVSRSVIGVKYEGEKDRARFLGAVLAMSEASTLIAKADYVVPVPMSVNVVHASGYSVGFANASVSSIWPNASSMPTHQ